MATVNFSVLGDIRQEFNQLFEKENLATHLNAVGCIQLLSDWR
jgi:hypothetical protein